MKDSYEAVRKNTTKAVAASAVTKKIAKAKTQTNFSTDHVKEKELAEHNKQTLKTMIKNKLHSSVQKKEDQKTIKEIHVTFPKDKPTYSLELLGKEPSQDISVDEEWLLKKAS
jgi:hypothetical protein